MDDLGCLKKLLPEGRVGRAMEFLGYPLISDSALDWLESCSLPGLGWAKGFLRYPPDSGLDGDGFGVVPVEGTIDAFFLVGA
jgi:hypothetical protein